MWKIIYNGNCSKSRAAKAYLDEKGIEYEIVNYLDEPLTAEIIQEILTKVGVGIDGVIRTGEEVFKAISGEWFTWSDAEKINFVVKNPIILQRPIVIRGEKGVIARPEPTEIERIL